jgi:predicted phosphodiesterase
LYQDIDDTRIIFAGHGIDPEAMDKYLHVEKFNILMTHHTIVKEHVVFEHYLFEDFITSANMVTVAHYHPYQGIIERKDGVTFVAPGSIARKKRTKEDVDRIPKCVYFSIENKKIKTLKEVAIPCEADIWVNKKVLDIDDELIYNDIESSVSDMRTLLSTQSIFPSLEDGVKFYADQRKVDDEIRNYVIGRLKNV